MYGFNFDRSQGFRWQINAVLDCSDKGSIEGPQYKWDEMMIVMRFMDELRRQIGMKYPTDKQIQQDNKLTARLPSDNCLIHHYFLF